MRLLEPWHLAILAVVFVALFGAKRLPDSARSLGESLHIFKKALHENPDGAGAVPVAATVPVTATEVDNSAHRTRTSTQHTGWQH
jgi:sec-independent protein translocase protein TatA